MTWGAFKTICTVCENKVIFVYCRNLRYEVKIGIFDHVLVMIMYIISSVRMPEVNFDLAIFLELAYNGIYFNALS